MTQTVTRPDAGLVAAVQGIGTATLHEAGGQIGALPSYIKPVSPDWYVCGPAMTVLSPPKDNLWLHRGIYHADPGDVMVVDTGHFHEAGYWGEIMTHAAQQVGMAGPRHRRLRSRRLHPRGTSACRSSPPDSASAAPPRTRTPTGPSTSPSASARYGSFPGDLVVGDRDGVVVVPPGPHRRGHREGEGPRGEGSRHHRSPQGRRTHRRHVRLLAVDPAGNRRSGLRRCRQPYGCVSEEEVLAPEHAP